MKLSRTTKTCLILGFALFCVFRVSQRGQLYDSRYALLASSQLINQQTLQLDEFVDPLRKPTKKSKGKLKPPYQLKKSNGHRYYFYPPGTTLLSVPYVYAAQLVGIKIIDEDGQYQSKTEKKLQRTLAATLMAALGCIFFLTARELLPHRESLWVAISGSLGTQIWSTASRSMWAHTFLVLLLGIALLILVRVRVRQIPIPPILLGTVLSWMFFCRQTGAISILGITVVIALTQRKQLPLFLLTGAAWLTGFIFFSFSIHGQALPPYYLLKILTYEHFAEALLGQLVSPARGLLVYVPLLFFVIYLLWTGRKRLTDPMLAITGITCIGVQLLLISGHRNWVAGWGFGPRLMVDIIPWAVLLAILGLSARLLRDDTPRQLSLSRPERICFVLLFVASLSIHGVGANSKKVQVEPANPWKVSELPFLKASK